VKSLSGDCDPLISPGGENRLIGLDAPSSTQPSSSRQSLRFKYDHQGRRTSKTVSNWTGLAWSLSYSTKFIYDGWNLLAEVNATNNAVLRSYLWGIDASGTPQGAGGVGGLLATRDSSGSATTNCFLAYDGNHNVRGLIDTKAGTSAAEYEFDPFGNVLKASGASAQSNPLRFSTKYQDTETAWNYYGYRYRADGRWNSRDNMEEGSGPNLYEFAGNSPLQIIDPTGQLNYYIFLHFNTPRTSMPDSHHAATKASIASSDYGRWEPCAPGCKKRVGIDINLVVNTWFESGFSLTQRNVAGHTPIEHENGHADIALHQWAEPIDVAATDILGKCYPVACADAVWDYFLAFAELARRSADFADINFDIAEFALQNDPNERASRDAARAAVANARISEGAASSKRDSICNSKPK